MLFFLLGFDSMTRFPVFRLRFSSWVLNPRIKKRNQLLAGDQKMVAGTLLLLSWEATGNPPVNVQPTLRLDVRNPHGCLPSGFIEESFNNETHFCQWTPLHELVSHLSLPERAMRKAGGTKSRSKTLRMTSWAQLCVMWHVTTNFHIEPVQKES